MKSTAVVGSGSLLVKLITLGITILIMRACSPEDYGVVTVAVTLMTVLPVLLDFGTSPSIVRFGALLESKGLVSQKTQLFTAIFYLRVVMSVIVLVAGWMLSPAIAGLFLHDTTMKNMVLIAFLGASGQVFLQFFASVFQAEERYINMMGLNLAESALRLMGICVMFFVFHRKSPEDIVLIYAVTSFIPVFFIGGAFRKYSKWHAHVFKGFHELFKLSFWFMVSKIFLLIFMNFDVFIIASFCSGEELGFYGAGFKIASILGLAVSALLTVLMPMASQQTSRRELRRFIRKSLLGCGVAALGMLPFVFMGSLLLKLLAGQAYLPANDVFVFLTLDQMAMVAFIPVFIALFMINRPKLLAIFTGLEMALNVAGDIIFVPRYGAEGAAAVTLATRLLVSSIVGIVLLKKLKSDAGFVQPVSLGALEIKGF